MESQERLLERIKHYYEDYFRFDAVYYKWCARYEIKDTTLFILERIYTAPEKCTQKYLCEKLSYPKQTISASLKQLEHRGFITRWKDPDDFRGNIIAFTPEGQAFADNVVGEMRKIELCAFEGMTQDERDTVEKGLHILADSLQKCFPEQ